QADRILDGPDPQSAGTPRQERGRRAARRDGAATRRGAYRRKTVSAAVGVHVRAKGPRDVERSAGPLRAAVRRLAGANCAPSGSSAAAELANEAASVGLQ